MKRFTSMMVCLALCFSTLAFPAYAMEVQGNDTSKAGIAREVVMYNYTETISYEDFDSIPQEIYRTKLYHVGSQVVPCSGVLTLKQVVKVSKYWKATYSGQLVGYQ